MHNFDLLFRLCLAACVCFIFASCGEDERTEERSAVDVKRLSTDVHVAIAQHNLVLPFIALEDYAYQHQSFSLNRKGDREHALSEADKLLSDTADFKHPLAFDSLSIVVRTYGWNDSDMHQIQMCPLLTREWARSVCDNPWAAIQQALPGDRFRLVDLRRLQIDDPHRLGQCVNNGKPRRTLPQSPGEAVMVCEASDYDGNKNRFHSAVVRIDGNLGALWTVWQYGKNDETAEAMTEREGKAIVAFVQNALGESEDFPALHATMCRLRRPGSNEGIDPRSPGCASAVLPGPSRSTN